MPLLLAIQFRPFHFHALKYFKMIWLSNLLKLTVHDEGYSRMRSKFDSYVFFISSYCYSDNFLYIEIKDTISAFISIKYQFIYSKEYKKKKYHWKQVGINTNTNTIRKKHIITTSHNPVSNVSNNEYHTKMWKQ